MSPEAQSLEQQATDQRAPGPALRDEPSALVAQLLAMADDEFLLGHGNSEWTGHAPILEEDIAFTNIALDELGHAGVWFGLVHDLTGESPDRLVYFRDPDAWRNSQLVELPKGDWAFAMLRQYLFDAAEAVRLGHLVHSTYQPLADAAAKIRTEEIYHYRHTQAWIKRLGLGTEESHRRLQAALDQLWPYALQLFVPLPQEAQLVAEGVLAEAASLQQKWDALVRPVLEASELHVPAERSPAAASREKHTAHLEALLSEMQEVARSGGPEVQW